MNVWDTNIVAAMIFDEKDATREVRKLFDLFPEFCVSPLWRWEFGNVVAMKLRRKDISQQAADHALELAQAFFSPREKLVAMSEVLKVSKMFGLIFYDAEHLALAKSLKGRLVTQDKEILQKAGDGCVTVGGLLKEVSF